MPVKFRSPSIAKLREVYGDNAPEAKRILRMTRAELLQTDAGNARALECHNAPPTWDIRMHALNALEDGNGGQFSGLETVALGDGSLVEYLNAGDSYVATVYRLNGNYYVGDIGSLIERRDSMDLQDALPRGRGW